MASNGKTKQQLHADPKVNLPAVDTEAEEALIDCVLINPPSIQDIQWFKPEWCWDKRYEWALEACFMICKRGEPLDEQTLISELQLMGRWEDFGGYMRLWEIGGRAKSSLNALGYARTVARNAAKRGLLKAADEIAALADSHESDTRKLLDSAHAIIDALPSADIGEDMEPLSRSFQSEFDRLEAIQNGELQPMAGISTGYTDLDNLLGGGYQGGNFIIVAGRPGWGKTSFMLNTAVNQARTKKRVAFFSLEMDAEELTRRVISMLTGIPTQTLRRGDLTAEQWALFVEASVIANSICEYIEISKIPDVNLSYIRNKSRDLLRSDPGVHAVYVDYLGLMQAEKDKDSRRMELEVISRGFKMLARELRRPVVVGAQMNRAIEQRATKEPQMSDLRETGAQEQDTDAILFIYPEDETEKTQRTVKVEKHRNGPTGKFYLGWIPERTLLRNHADESGRGNAVMWQRERGGHDGR